MFRYFQATAVLGSLLAFGGGDHSNAVLDNDTTQLVERSAPPAEPGIGKASIFAVPREARILFLSR